MYLRIWQFRPNPQKIPEFVDVYGPNGEWAKLFRLGDGFVETELVQSTSDPDVYLTLDRWRDKESWEAFIASYAGDYAALDEKHKLLSTDEREIGNFNTTS